MKHNLKLLVISVFLSISLVYIIKHPEFFASSVLNIQEITEIQEKHRDIAYKTDNGMLDIFLPLTGFQADKIHNNQISITIAYDPSDITVNTANATGQVEYTLTNIQSGSFVLLFPNVTAINPNQSLFYVPYSGTSQRILIEDAFSLVNNEQSSLSIGKLSPVSIHGN